MTDGAGDALPLQFTAPLSVCVDVRHPNVYLALKPVQALAEELAIEVDWLPFPCAPMKAPPPVVAESTDDRGTRHRRVRARYLEADVHRYAAAQGLSLGDIYRAPDATPAALGLLWLRRVAPARAAAYLRRVCAEYWGHELDVADYGAVAGVLAALGEDAAAFSAFAGGSGPTELAELREALVAAGVFAVPSLIVEGEVFVGRAHLPLVRLRLQDEEAASSGT